MTSNLMIISLIQITKSSYIICREQCFKSLDLGERYCQKNFRNWQNLIVVSEVSGFHLWKENKENNESPWEPLSLGQVRWKVWEVQNKAFCMGIFGAQHPLNSIIRSVRPYFLWFRGGIEGGRQPWVSHEENSGYRTTRGCLPCLGGCI